jgi:hypothetical protein
MSIAQAKWESLVMELEGMLTKAKKTKDPIEYLVKNDLRSLCFKLQGLARIYEHLHNKKRFVKIKDQMKEIEDLLGQLDFYTTALKMWKLKKTVPVEIKDHLLQQIEEVKKSILPLLTEKYFDSDKRITRMKKKIASASWLEENVELEKIKEFLTGELDEIKELLGELPFTDMELQVHELRRKLRWISIYAQNLSGKIAYGQSINKTFTSMINKDARASIFNKLPSNKSIAHPILLDKNAFLALSTVIAELGKIKDEGLYTEYGKSLLMKILKLRDKNAVEKVNTIFKLGSTHDEILSRANDWASILVEKKLLDQLFDAH